MQKICLIYLWIKTILNPRFSYFDRVTASHLYGIYSKVFLGIIGANFNFEQDKLYIPEARAEIFDNAFGDFGLLDTSDYIFLIWTGSISGVCIYFILELLGV